MKRHWIAAALALATISAGSPVHACMGDAPLDLEDVHYADVVIVGRIANYRIVLDPIIRQEHEEWQSEFRGYQGETRMADSFMSDYARFDVQIEEVLSGQAGASIAVTWDNSTFPEPETMPPGPFLLALRRPGSASPPLRGPSATILPDPEPGALAVLQAPCSDAFIFESTSKRAAAVRKIIARGPKRRNAR